MISLLLEHLINRLPPGRARSRFETELQLTPLRERMKAKLKECNRYLSQIWHLVPEKAKRAAWFGIDRIDDQINAAFQGDDLKVIPALLERKKKLVWEIILLQFPSYPGKSKTAK